MTLPASGALAFSQIQTQFGGTNPVSISEYYAGAGLVGAGLAGNNGSLPASGLIAISKYRGAPVALSWTASVNLQASMLNPTGLADYFASNNSRTVALSQDGNIAVIGAPKCDTYGLNLGAAYVYARTGIAWTLVQELSISDFTGQDQFGFSVDISDDGSTIVIGSPYTDSTDATPKNSAGSVYVFTNVLGTWTETQRLQASDTSAGATFGYSVALSGDGTRLAIGAPSLSNGGAVYVFTNSVSWAQEQKVTYASTTTSDLFGCAVDMNTDGSRFVVGAVSATFGGTRAGKAYMFFRSGTVWTYNTLWSAVDGGTNTTQDQFGYAVAISGDGTTVIVGAPQDETSGNDTYVTGSITIWKYNGSVWQQQYTYKTAFLNEFRGGSVSLSYDGNTALVGLKGTSTGRGAAVVYTRVGTTWSSTCTLVLPAPTATDYLGTCVALSDDGGTALVGAIMGTPVANAGAAYVFVR